MSQPTLARIATIIWLLLAPVALAAEPAEADAAPSRTAPYECEAWAARIEALQASDDELERELGRLFAEPDLRYCQTRRVRLDDESESDSDWDLNLPGWRMLTEALRWLIIGVLVALVIWLLWRWRRRLARPFGSSRQRTASARAVEHAAAPKSGTLPDDIPAAAARAWQSGQARAAISLLYRGAVERLLPQGRADTEREVLAALRRQALAGGTRDYVGELVQAWQQTAWANSPPSQQGFEKLRDDWTAHCATPRESSQ